MTEHTPQCRYCRHYSAVWTPATAMYAGWCGLREQAALVPCEDYEREPGSDDE